MEDTVATHARAHAPLMFARGAPCDPKALKVKDVLAKFPGRFEELHTQLLGKYGEAPLELLSGDLGQKFWIKRGVAMVTQLDD